MGYLFIGGSRDGQRIPLQSLLNTIQFAVPHGSMKFLTGGAGMGEMTTFSHEMYRRFEIASGVHVYVHSSIVAADITRTLVDGYHPEKDSETATSE